MNISYKKTLLFLVVVTLFSTAFSQPILFTTAPVGNTTTQVRAPNGLSTYAYLRACALVKASELTNVASGSTLSTFGFTLSAGVSTNAVVGSFTLYLQNTGDVTYTKGTDYATAISSMTEVYASSMTIPVSATTTSIIVTLSTPFTYTGGGLYVAYDWYSPGPYSTTPATYRADGTGLSPGCASANSPSSAPTTLGTTAFRPNFLFGVNNPYANDIEVINIDAPGKVISNMSYSVTALIRNSSSVTNTNINVNLNIAGANTFSDTQSIPSLAAGATDTVTFTGFNPSTLGTNTISVSTPNDDNNANNLMSSLQTISCNEWSIAPSNANYNSSSPAGYGTTGGILTLEYYNASFSELESLNVAIGNNTPSVGKNIWGVLLNNSGNVVATTNTLTISNQDLGTIKSFTFSSAVSLAANTLYYPGVAMESSSTAYYPIGSSASNYVPYQKYGMVGLAGGTIVPFMGSLGYLGVESVLKTSLGVSVNSGSICNGNTFTISPIGYSTSTISGGNFVVSPTTSTTYTITGTNTQGCVTAPITSSVTILTNCSLGAALSLDGIDDKVDCGNTNNVFDVESGTIEAWFKTNNAGSSFRGIVVKENRYGLFLLDNKVYVHNWSGGSSYTSGNFINDNQWHHVAFSFQNGVTNGSLVYIDGVAQTPFTYDKSTGTSNLMIGENGNNNQNFGGLIDEVRIWNRVLCASEIQNNMVGEILTTASGLIANYHFNQGFADDLNTATTTLTEASGFNNNGTLTNFALTTGSGSNWTAPGFTGNGTIVTPYLKPTVTITGANSVCIGSSTTLTASGNFTDYTWLNGPATSTINVNPSVQTTYSVIATTSVGCVSDTATKTIGVNNLPTITAVSSNSLICVGESVTLTAGNGVSYFWINNNETTPSIFVSPTVTVTYSVTGVDNNGCENTATVTQDVSTCTGLTNNSYIDNMVAIYPNPATSELTVVLPNSNQETEILVTNYLGQLVMSKKTSSVETTLHIDTLENGVYFVKTFVNNQVSTIKLIKY